VTWDVDVATDVGKREINQDRFLALDMGGEAWFLAVADGVGGRNSGEVAAELAVQELLKVAPRWKVDKMPETVSDTIDGSLRKIHDTILAQARRQPALKGMATTIACALVLPSGVLHRYAGDSILWWVRGDSILYRSRPHVVPSGSITSCLGGPSAPILSPRRQDEYDWFMKVKPGDVLLLATDGLFRNLAPGKLLQLLTEPGSAKETTARLIEAAIKAEVDDNVTVVVAKSDTNSVASGNSSTSS
jgi:protein phosphatase